MPKIDGLEDWEKDFLEGGKEVVIRRTRVRTRVALNEFEDIRLSLQLAADELEDVISGLLERQLVELRAEIAAKKFPPQIAVKQFEPEATMLAKRAAEECSMLIDRLLAKLATRLDPESDQSFSTEERDRLYARYGRLCETLCAAEARRLESSVYAGQPAAVFVEPETSSATDKGSSELLRGRESVSFRIAERYLGIKKRQRQKLVKTGVLFRLGGGHNRTITVDSLRKYLPPNPVKEKTN